MLSLTLNQSEESRQRFVIQGEFITSKGRIKRGLGQ